jgi:hypothetical protein
MVLFAFRFNQAQRWSYLGLEKLGWQKSQYFFCQCCGVGQVPALALATKERKSLLQLQALPVSVHYYCQAIAYSGDCRCHSGYWKHCDASTACQFKYCNYWAQIAGDVQADDGCVRMGKLPQLDLCCSVMSYDPGWPVPIETAD